MKKILFYINAINGGGAERVMVNLSSQFAADGYTALLVTSFRDNEEYLLSEKVKRISLEDKEICQGVVGRNLRRILKLRKICKKERPDVVISFMGEPNFRAVCAVRGLKTKLIISVRSDPKYEYAGRFRTFIGKFFLPLADGCVFQTEDAQKWFPTKLQNKSKIIFNSVKEDFFSVKREKVPNLIVTCGRLAPVKNQKMLVDAFSLVSKRHRDATLFIYGKGSMEPELKKRIREQNMETRVFLKGNSSHIPEVLSKAALFVLSSDLEGMPNALMEAMAVGVPSIATDCPCGGPKILINNGVNGLLVPVGDVDALSKAMDSLLSDETYAENLGKRARESAQAYRTERIYDEWKNYVEEVIGS